MTFTVLQHMRDPEARDTLSEVKRVAQGGLVLLTEETDQLAATRLGPHMSKFVSAVALLVSTVWVMAQPKAEMPRVVSMKAYLYFQEKGSLSARDIIAEPGVLWNTIIGAGDAGSPSAAVLVLVEVRHEKSGGRFPGVVRLDAVQPGKPVRKQTVRLDSFFAEQGPVFIPFLVYGTGCGTLELTAQVEGKGVTSGKLSKAIPFLCGD